MINRAETVKLATNAKISQTSLPSQVIAYIVYPISVSVNTTSMTSVTVLLNTCRPLISDMNMINKNRRVRLNKTIRPVDLYSVNIANIRPNIAAAS